MQVEMEAALPLLLEDRDDSEEEEGCTAHVSIVLQAPLHTLILYYRLHSSFVSPLSGH